MFVVVQVYGLWVKLYVDQFYVIGGIELVCEVGVLSVDYFEVSGVVQIVVLVVFEIVVIILLGVMLYFGLFVVFGR